MNTKLPFCPDWSHWNTIANFEAITPRPFFAITKASEGVAGVDTNFVRFMAGMKIIGCHRGAYHFNRKAYDGAGQARHFISVIDGYIDDNTVLILDVEEGGESPAQLKAWFDTVRAKYLRNRLMVYSRQNILDPIALSMTQAQKDYFRAIPTWIAGYPSNPDTYNTVPSWYIPNQSAWGPTMLWQYSDHGAIPGVGGECDMNWINPAYQQILGNVTTPILEDVTTELFPGVTQISGVCNGWRWWLQICDPAKVRYEVVDSGLWAVSTAADTMEAQLAWNGSDYDRITHELHIGAPSFYDSGDVRNDDDGDIYSVSKLIENGAIHPRCYYNDLTATEGHARTCFGKTADGKILHFVSEGVFPNQGLRLIDCATLMQKYGAIVAGSSGGGGDTTLVIKGELINVPEDRDPPLVGPNVERRIPQVLLAYTQEGNSMNGTAKEMLGNTTTVRNEPSRYGADSGSKLPAGGVVEFVEIVPAVVKGIADNRDDKWLKLPSGKFINYILNGREYYHVLTMPNTTTTPPAEKMANVHIVLTDDEGYSATVDVDVVMVKA